MTPADRPTRRLAAVWFADVVNFTTLSARDEDLALRLVRTLQALSRRVVRHYGGTIVKFLGDGILAEFPSADRAVRSALVLTREFQRLLEEVGVEPGVTNLRVGVHLGEVVVDADGDIYGDGVNRASRMEGKAQPGEVVVSEDVWRQLRQRSEFSFQDLGEHTLKGIDEPVRIYGAAVEGELEALPDGAGDEPADADAGEPVERSSGGRSSHPRAVAVGIAAAVAAFIGLGLWTAASGPGMLSGEPDSAEVVKEDRARAVAEAPARSVAVLPFENLAGDSVGAFVAGGIAEELILDLGRMEGLRVAGRTSSFLFGDSDLDVQGIAGELGVRTVVDGSVRVWEERVRVNAELVDASTGYTLWSNGFDHTTEDLLALQLEISRSIADALKVPLSRSGGPMPGQTADPEAHMAHMAGLHLLGVGTPEALHRAEERFLAALERDPDYALARIGLARTWLTQVERGMLAPTEAHDRAESEASAAVGGAPEMAATQVLFGEISMGRYDWDDAESAFLYALELDPGHAPAHFRMAELLLATGRLDEAAAALGAGEAIDPLAPEAGRLRGLLLLRQGRSPAAVRALRAMVGRHPEDRELRLALALARAGREGGEEDPAGEGPEGPDLEAVGGEGWGAESLAAVAAVTVRRGSAEEIRRVLERLQRTPEPWREGYALAALHAAQGDTAVALDRLEEAVAARSPAVLWLAVDPSWAPLRDAPRFRALLEQVGLPSLER